MKKAIISVVCIIMVLFVALLILFGIKTNALTEKTGEIKIDAYDSVRLTDMLVLYTKEHERNEYGYELLVDTLSGKVRDKDKKVEYTSGCYIISGHGEKAVFLKNVRVGDTVKVEDTKVTFARNTLISGLEGLKAISDKTDALISQRRLDLYDIDENGIKRASEDFDFKILELFGYIIFNDITKDELDNKIQDLEEIINQKYYYSLQNRAVEGRGLWHRPNNTAINELTLDGVKELVKHIKALGINTLYVETYWHGRTTYFSDYLNTQHPATKDGEYGEYGNDYMLAIISECHKEGIEVHAWVETLSANFGPNAYPSYIKEKWVCYSEGGKPTENFLDPSNPEVREFIFTLISEMLTKYDFDGISYDYIRYSGEYGGICENSATLFSKEYGYAGNNILSDLKTSKDLKEKWDSFRASNITSLVKELSLLIREINKELIISASPYGYINYAKDFYMQDIESWLKYGYLDVVLPMLYTDSTEVLKNNAEDYCEYSDRVLQYTGIAPLYYESTLRNHQELINVIHSLGISGSSLFASQSYITDDDSLTQSILHAMSVSTHTGTAVLPTADANEIFGAWKTQLLDRYQRLYKDKMSEIERGIIEDFALSTKSGMQNPKDIMDTLSTLVKLKEKAKTLENKAARERISEEIDYVYNILDASISRYLVRHGYWNIELNPERPDIYSIDFK